MNKRYKRSGESLFIKARHQEEKHFSSAPQKKFSMTKEYKSVLGTHKVKINYYQSEEKDTERGRERESKQSDWKLSKMLCLICGAWLTQRYSLVMHGCLCKRLTVFY